MAIQVSYNPKKSTETCERESTALIKLSKVLDCKRLIILTYELEEEIVVKDKKIEVILYGNGYLIYSYYPER